MTDFLISDEEILNCIDSLVDKKTTDFSGLSTPSEESLSLPSKISYIHLPLFSHYQSFP
jgi:hypothetical protein